MLASSVEWVKSRAAVAGMAVAAVPNVVDVAIVGGGLSGLLVAEGVGAAGLSFAVLEAHDTELGGRLRNNSRGLDLGGAWVWPRHGQHRVAALLERLVISTFAQPGDAGGGAELCRHAVAQLPPLLRVHTSQISPRHVEPGDTLLAPHRTLFFLPLEMITFFLALSTHFEGVIKK